MFHYLLLVLEMFCMLDCDNDNSAVFTSNCACFRCVCFALQRYAFDTGLDNCEWQRNVGDCKLGIKLRCHQL
jgi:hypothetical protein